MTKSPRGSGEKEAERPAETRLEEWSGIGLLDHLWEGCQVIDFDWRYRYLNEAAAAHGRRRREELVGRTLTEAYPGVETTELFRELERCMEQRTATTLENEFRYPDGSTCWFELRVQPVPEGLFILSLDITERKRAERAMEHRIERLRSLRAIDLAILGTTDLRLTLKTVLEETRNRLEADGVLIFQFEPAASLLEVTASTGFREPSVARSRLHVGAGACGRAALLRRIVVASDLQPEELLHELPPGSPTKGCRHSAPRLWWRGVSSSAWSRPPTARHSVPPTNGWPSSKRSPTRRRSRSTAPGRSSRRREPTRS